MNYRAKIGVISPVESLTEDMFHKYAPLDVDIRTTRIQMKEKTPETLFLFCDMMEEAAKVFNGYPQDVILFGCAGATCISGKGWDLQCGERIRKASGSFGTTTTTATLEAFRAFNVKKLCLLAPYPPEVTETEVRYFGYYGVETVSRKRLITDGQENDASRIVLEQMEGSVLNGADAVLISCMALDTTDAIEPLERKFGIPVFTSHQVSLWSVLRHAGLKDRIAGLGSLFEK